MYIISVCVVNWKQVVVFCTLHLLYIFTRVTFTVGVYGKKSVFCRISLKFCLCVHKNDDGCHVSLSSKTGLGRAVVEHPPMVREVPGSIQKTKKNGFPPWCSGIKGYHYD